VDTAVCELAHAEAIIKAMLHVMTSEQKAAVATALETAGESNEGLTRYHERRAALTAFGK
jgi:hypothetical protein